MSRKIIGVTVGTPINPQAVVNKTELAEQVENNTTAIGELKATINDLDTLPEVTEEDNGKVLTVVDGAWAMATIEVSAELPSAEEASF